MMTLGRWLYGILFVSCTPGKVFTGDKRAYGLVTIVSEWKPVFVSSRMNMRECVVK